MKRNRIKRLTKGLLLLLVVASFAAETAFASEQSVFGTAGSIVEATRPSEIGDERAWLTIQGGEAGVRVVTEDGRELLLADNYGGIYLDGDVYLNGKLLDADLFRLGNGMMYLLLVISISLNIVVLVKTKRRQADNIQPPMCLNKAEKRMSR